MEEMIDLEPLAKDIDYMEQLDQGKIVVSRSQNHFLYVLADNGEYHVFTHTVGESRGGSKRFPMDEKHKAIIKHLIMEGSVFFSVTFDPKMDLYSVLASAEEGILSILPIQDEEGGPIDFNPLS